MRQSERFIAWLLIKGEEKRQRQAAESFNMKRRWSKPWPRCRKTRLRISAILDGSLLPAHIEFSLPWYYIDFICNVEVFTQEGTEILYLLEKSSGVRRTFELPLHLNSCSGCWNFSGDVYGITSLTRRLSTLASLINDSSPDLDLQSQSEPATSLYNLPAHCSLNNNRLNIDHSFSPPPFFFLSSFRYETFFLISSHSSNYLFPFFYLFIFISFAG